MRSTSRTAGWSLLGVAALLIACGGSAGNNQPADDTTTAETEAEDTAATVTRPASDTLVKEAEQPVADRASERTEPSGQRAEEPPTTEDRAPEPTTMTVPAGTQIVVQLRDTLSTRTAAPGDTFTAHVDQDVTRERRVVIPAGSVVHGRVTAVQRAGEDGSKQGVIKVAFDAVTVDGSRYALDAEVQDANPEAKSGSSTGEDAAKVGGAAAAGAILGRVIGGDGTGAAVGAALGAAAGTGIVLATKNGYAILPAGSNLTLELTSPLSVPLPPSSEPGT